ncbi:hypothetical protein JWV37_12340 [Sulfurospirillum sp. T05]|uniref:Polysaccharide chain length determinant N-terminal domain-containing protein n=1 Tax=Sulfurospirillum tamanense TaxID=2813362 RepID=A0ABS2WV98_9BACT|nr:Wzz/FepE/Etk N-terminal domain-containing protein [Sulfurospirillum tamanensis]MBN2965572.1 hypothetical protein [Sulfurospirillum tamanensis]
MNETSKPILQEDEIDLRELFKTLWDKRVFIALFTCSVTALAIVYALFQNPTPLYKGTVFVEIGEIQRENFQASLLDHPSNLAIILEREKGVQATVPKGSVSILEVQKTDTDVSRIKESLGAAIEFIMQRHQEKAAFHENVIMTKQIGEISAGTTPINTPKKQLLIVVGAMTGFIFSIFLVFLMQFIRGDEATASKA